MMAGHPRWWVKFNEQNQKRMLRPSGDAPKESARIQFRTPEAVDQLAGPFPEIMV